VTRRNFTLKPCSHAAAGDIEAAKDAVLVTSQRKLFHVVDGIFIGTEYGAVDSDAFHALRVARCVKSDACDERQPSPKRV